MSTFFYLVIYLLVFATPALVHVVYPTMLAYYRTHFLFGAAPALAQGAVMQCIFAYLLVSFGFLFAWAMRQFGQSVGRWIKARRSRAAHTQAAEDAAMQHALYRLFPHLRPRNG